MAKRKYKSTEVISNFPLYAKDITNDPIVIRDKTGVKLQINYVEGFIYAVDMVGKYNPLPFSSIKSFIRTYIELNPDVLWHEICTMIRIRKYDPDYIPRKTFYHTAEIRSWVLLKDLVTNDNKNIPLNFKLHNFGQIWT